MSSTSCRNFAESKLLFSKGPIDLKLFLFEVSSVAGQVMDYEPKFSCNIDPASKKNHTMYIQFGSKIRSESGC